MKRRPSSKPVRAEDVARAVVEIAKRVRKVERRCARCRGEACDAIGFRLEKESRDEDEFERRLL